MQIKDDVKPLFCFFLCLNTFKFICEFVYVAGVEITADLRAEQSDVVSAVSWESESFAELKLFLVVAPVELILVIERSLDATLQGNIQLLQDFKTQLSNQWNLNMVKDIEKTLCYLYLYIFSHILLLSQIHFELP